MNEPQVDATARSATSLPLDRFWSERGLSNLAALALTVLALVLCFLIVQPFVSSLAWATALAVVAWPLHRRVARRVPWPSAAAALSVVAIALLLVVPSGMLIPGVIDEALSGYRLIRSQIESNAWDAALDRNEWIGSMWEWLRQRVDMSVVLQQVGTFLTQLGSLAVTTSFVGLIEFALTFFFLFFGIATPCFRAFAPCFRCRPQRPTGFSAWPGTQFLRRSTERSWWASFRVSSAVSCSGGSICPPRGSGRS